MTGLENADFEQLHQTWDHIGFWANSLIFLLVGAYSSIEYAVMYGQRNRSAWAPYMAPIKIIMGIGVLLMLLQAVATFFKDLAKAKGEKL